MRLAEAAADHDDGLRSLRGGEGDALVYLHGGGGLHRDPALELLADDFRLIAFELPGFGGSTDEPAAIQDAVQAVGRSLHAAGLERCTLVGTSLGALVALHVALEETALEETALEEAERVEALVLLSPPAFRSPDWRPPADIERALFARADGPRPEPVSPEVAERQRAVTARLLDGVDDDALRAWLPTLRVPTLVVCGTEDGLFLPAQSRVYRQLMPNCSYVLLYGAAHELGWDRPQALAALVADFARRREAFVIGVSEARP